MSDAQFHAFAPLIAAESEARARMESAEKSVAEANRRLEADLAAGRDTSTARRSLHEITRLCDEATHAALEASQALMLARQRRDGEQADELVQTAGAAIAASLSRFNLKEPFRGNRP